MAKIPNKLHHSLLRIPRNFAKGFPRRQALPLCRMVVPFPLPAPVRRIVPHHLLCHDVINPHTLVLMGRSRISFSTFGNGVAFPHSSLVVIARLAVDLKDP